MHNRRMTAVLGAAVCLQAGTAHAQTITFAEALARARERAPDIVSARLAQDEARARLAGASLRLAQNPQIDIGAGNRDGRDGRFTDLEIGVTQMFEPRSRRTSRIAGAQAAIEESSARVDEITRLMLRATGAAYYRALHAESRIALLTAVQEIARSVHAAAERRFAAGDIAVLDVNLARASLGRVRAELAAARAVKAAALGELKQLLQIDGDLDVAGPLSAPAAATLESALRSAAARPELRILEAGIREAEADVQRAGTFSRPDYGVAARYSREEGDQIVFGGITISLPLFTTGQDLRAAGAARVSRLRAELEAVRRRTQTEVRTAFDTLSHRLAALDVLEKEILPGVGENEALTARSFEVGQLGLPDLLLIRREILDTRFQHLDALLEAALARLDLDASAATLR